MFLNIWANLTRKDTGEGIKGKWLVSYLDGVNISRQPTQDKTGYAGPFDINPKTAGRHLTSVIFEGDSDYESCESEVIGLTVDPNLLRTEITMTVESWPSGKIVVTGRAYEIRPDGSKTTPAYGLPLYLMVFDSTSTKRLQPVASAKSQFDGTFVIEYTFVKLGTYAIFVNFLGDAKYISAWSNNGRTTIITVTGGGLPLSFEETITVTVTGSKTIKRFLGATEPTTPDGYERAPEYDLDCGVLGKYWAYVKKSA
jgi:hypothetical protein